MSIQRDTSSARQRDPEGRPVPKEDDVIREKMLDKTLADSYPASDPPSTIPDPGEDDSLVPEGDQDKAA